MHHFLFIDSVYFKTHPTGTLGADIKIKIENILGQPLGGCKLAWEFPWLPAQPAALTPAALSVKANKVNSTTDFGRRGKEGETDEVSKC